MIKIYRNKGESAERLIGNWKKRVQSTKLVNGVRDKMYHTKKLTRRTQRIRAVYNSRKKSEMDRLRLYT